MFGKAKGAWKGSFSKFFVSFSILLWAISSISVANDFVFDQEFDRMIALFNNRLSSSSGPAGAGKTDTRFHSPYSVWMMAC